MALLEKLNKHNLDRQHRIDQRKTRTDITTIRWALILAYKRAYRIEIASSLDRADDTWDQLVNNHPNALVDAFAVLCHGNRISNIEPQTTD